MTDANRQSRSFIPPQLFWPGLVVALLLLGVATGLAVVVAAHSDGGPALVEDYYRQALAWDETQKARAESAALGWRAEVTVLAAGENPALREVEVVVLDAEGAPVSGLGGSVRARRSDAPGPGAAVPLAEASPGAYRQHLPIPRGGLWDFEIDAGRGGARFVATVRREL